MCVREDFPGEELITASERETMGFGQRGDTVHCASGLTRG